MKRDILVQIAKKLSQVTKINAIERVDDTIVKIVFDKGEVYYFDLKRGDSYIFKKEKAYKRVKNYIAPFDVVLNKKFTNAKVEKVEVQDGNKIFSIIVQSASKYKHQIAKLQFEFTGRNTNIVILDENNIILEALRHIDINTSFRQVRVGVELLELPPKEFEDKPFEIEDIDSFLIHEYTRREHSQLDAIKKQKTTALVKKRKKLEKILQGLENEEKLLSEASKLEYDANLILSNIHNLKNYQKEVTLKDYERNDRVITIPKQANTPAVAANLLFSQSKKKKQKARNSHIERDNLQGKIDFLDKLANSVEGSKSVDEVNLYLPKQPKKQKSRLKVDTNIESFFIEGIKISLGKNEKGNITLLKDAKMGDIWMHLKDMPSTHVIIRTDKKSVPDSVLEFGAKLCVQFSVVSSGSYLVDYTYRRNVKMRDGANVNYVEYKTLKALKE
jgi:predicted ribosome quality control (RQC) complex YloA/Tae2 family protein